MTEESAVRTRRMSTVAQENIDAALARRSTVGRRSASPASPTAAEDRPLRKSIVDTLAAGLGRQSTAAPARPRGTVGEKEGPMAIGDDADGGGGGDGARRTSTADVEISLDDDGGKVESGGAAGGKLLLDDAKERPPVAVKREVWAWYLYDWANGPFFYSCLNFLPLLLVSMAGSMPVGCTRTRNCETCDNCDGCTPGGASDCSDTVAPLGFNIRYTSFPLYCTMLSVFLQLFFFMMFGSHADYGSARKRIFLICNTIGAVCMLCVIFMADVRLYWLAGIMLIVANVVMGMAVIYYNAYLSLLATSHHAVEALAEEGGSADDILGLIDATSNSMSSRGLAAGFTGQVVILLINMVIFLLVKPSGLAARVNIFIDGVWILAFGTFAIVNLKTRPGPPLPLGHSYLGFGFYKTWQTVKMYKRLPELFKFFAAYFVYSDGHSTIGVAASIFAQTELGMSLVAILFALLEVSFYAVVGCFFFLFLNRFVGISPKRIILINLFLLTLLPIYGVVSLRSPTEFYLLAAVFGLNTGAIQAFTRTLFSSMVPEGRESSMYSFYEISDKGSAWLGPLCVSIVNDTTGSFRLAFLSLIFFFIVGAIMLTFVRPEAGVEQAKRCAEEDDEQRAQGNVII